MENNNFDYANAVKLAEEKQEMKMAKYCPIVSIAMKEYTTCMKEKCAWWEKSFEGCAVTVLSGTASFVAGEMMIAMEDDEQK